MSNLHYINYLIEKSKTRRTIRRLLEPLYENCLAEGTLAEWEYTDIILKRFYKDTFLYPKFAEYAISSRLVDCLSKDTIVKALIDGVTIDNLIEMDILAETKYSLSV